MLSYIKISGSLLLCCLATSKTSAQNTPVLSETFPTNNAYVMQLPPQINTNGAFNYVRSFVPKVPIDDTAALHLYASSSDVQISTLYRDGFNRDMQSILRSFSPAGHLVTITDPRFQQDAYSFLPYVTNANGFRNYAFAEQRNFYIGLYPNEGYFGYSYAHNSSDAAGRKQNSYAPGKSQVGQTLGSTLRTTTNTASEVRIWSLDGAGLPVTTGYYPAAVLFGELGISTEGSESLVYKDKDGKVLYEKKYQKNLVSSAGVTPVYVYTYYIYDEKGQLRYIIPPKASALVSGGTLSQTILDNLCFRYVYDDKGRLVEKQVPGKAVEYFVYDKRNRQVLYQDGNLRGDNDWTFTLYDVLDRPTISGLYQPSGTESRTLLQTAIDGPSVYAAPYLFYYIKNYELHQVYPVQIEACAPLSYTYYDDYQIVDPLGAVWNTYANELAFTSSELQLNLPGADTPGRSLRLAGRVTGTKVKIMPVANADASKVGDWTESVLYYDDKGRLIYAVSKDLYQGSPIHIQYSGSQYDFTNRVLTSKQVSENYKSTDGQTRHAEVSRNTYNNSTGQLAKTEHKVDGGPWNITSLYSYDALGRAKDKVLGNYGETQSFDYNIRGQLTGINKVYAETGDRQGESRTFGESLKYDYGFTTPRYDGKIAGMVWRGTGSSKAMAYGYRYDKEGRLTSADYRRLELTNTWRNDLADYSVSNLGYDANGNIESMKQRGLNLSGQPDNIDRLGYTYSSNSNQLIAVTDTVTANFGRGDFQDGNTIGADYQYDVNGNLTRDNNKQIVSVTYTHLNKPEKILYTNGSKIEYCYNAAGTKVQERITNAGTGTVTVTDYLGNKVYRNDTLQYILTGEGRSIYYPSSQTSYEEFFVKDHLGNVRSVIEVSYTSTQEYLATYEVASANLENLFFEHIDQVRDDKPGGISGDMKAARLNGADPDRTTGTSMLLKVMAGDKVEMNVNNFYENYDPGNDDPVVADNLLSSIVSTLTGGIGGMPGENHNTAIVNHTFTQDNYNIFKQIVKSDIDLAKPRASLNYILFDESMRIVGSSSGSFQANGNGTWEEIGTTTPIEIPLNGYLAVYLQNASKVTGCLTCGDVYFDKMKLRFTRGKLKEEAHYYPHGLPIAGMGSAAQGFKENRHKYQGNEYIKDLGLNWMDFQARQYDPQIGRFLGVDPLADESGQEIRSPYAAMDNSPGMMVDPDGKDAMASYQRDDKGNVTITLSSTIFVMGYGANQSKIDEYNQYLKDNQSMLTQVFNNDDGTTTTMIIDMKYSVATQKDIARVTDESTRNGDNLMILGNDEGRSTGGFVKREVRDPITGKVKEEKFTDFKARLGNKDSEIGQFYSKSSTAFHETMHLFGLRDWYRSSKEFWSVGKNDVMNDQNSKTPIIHQIHWNNWRSYINNFIGNLGINEFILNRPVEE